MKKRYFLICTSVVTRKEQWRKEYGTLEEANEDYIKMVTMESIRPWGQHFSVKVATDKEEESA